MIGNHIKKIRKLKKISINTLAAMSGISLGYLSDIENNKALNPSFETLDKLADALEVSRDRLAGEAASSIIEDRLEEIGMTMQDLAEKAVVPLKFLQNLDSIVPDLEIDLGEECYRYITSIAWVLGIPGSKLRLAFARQEIPVSEYPDGHGSTFGEDSAGPLSREASQRPLITLAASRRDGYDKPLTPDEAAVVEAAAKAALDAYRAGKNAKG